jgi:predicted transcriptional regulator YdeE
MRAESNAKPEQEYRFETIEEFWLVGLGSSGPYFSPHKVEANWVMPLWQEFIRRHKELLDPVDRSTFISPCHGRETDFTFYCGFAAPLPPETLPEGMLSLRIPTHTYVVGRVDGPRSEIDRLYRVLPQWAAGQGHAINERILWLERYAVAPNLHPDGPFHFEICLPVL